MSRIVPMLAALAMGWQSPQADASDVSVRVNASTFNQFVQALGPIPFSGHYAFRTVVDAGIFGRHTITWCSSGYAGALTGLAVDINASRIRVIGDVSFSWCGLNFGAPGPELTANGNLTYNASDETLRLTFPSAIVRPTFNFLGWIIVLPVPIDIGGMLNIPPLSARPTSISFQTPSGPRLIRARMQDVRVTKSNGYVTVTSDVVLR